MYYKRLFVAIFFVWLIFILVLVFLAVKPASRSVETKSEPIPTTSEIIPVTQFVRTPSGFPTQKPKLIVIGSNPSDGEKNVDPFANITINFAGTYDFRDLKIALLPSIPYALRSSGNTSLVISPLLGFEPDISYTFTLFEKSTARELTSFDFTIQSKNHSTADTGPSLPELRIYFAQMAKEKPDYFLQNFVPLQTENFLLESRDFDETSQKFRFVATLEKAITKEQLELYLQNLGIDRSGIESLQIMYNSKN